MPPFNPVALFDHVMSTPLNSRQQTPQERYQSDLAAGVLLPDAAQANAIQHMQRLYDELLQPPPGPLARLLRRATGKGGVGGPAIKGVYFYGGVGRGKTYIMDAFFDCLPLEGKLRTHFHRFMQQVHADLARLKHQKNPLQRVAAGISEQARVLCFDEFFVSDIADAMILGGLFEHLFNAGVVLVATSNIHPDRLYENGLQRERFLPTIALLHRHTEVVELDGGVDYRLRALRQACLYFSPLGDEADAALQQSFNALVPAHADGVADAGPVAVQQLEVLGRPIPARRAVDGVVWFDFADLCAGARSAYDYIELARVYHTLILSNVPALDGARDDAARRFVSLVDELYDRHVKLIVSAAVPLPELYSGTELAFVFERTRSRLLEMQSEDYLAREHRP